jgi:hypothetical protein
LRIQQVAGEAGGAAGAVLPHTVVQLDSFSVHGGNTHPLQGSGIGKLWWCGECGEGLRQVGCQAQAAKGFKGKVVHVSQCLGETRHLGPREERATMLGIKKRMDRVGGQPDKTEKTSVALDARATLHQLLQIAVQPGGRRGELSFQAANAKGVGVRTIMAVLLCSGLWASCTSRQD